MLNVSSGERNLLLELNFFSYSILPSIVINKSRGLFKRQTTSVSVPFLQGIMVRSKVKHDLFQENIANNFFYLGFVLLQTR